MPSNPYATAGRPDHQSHTASAIYRDLMNISRSGAEQEPPDKPDTTALDELCGVARTAAQAVRRERQRILRARLQERLAEIVCAEGLDLWTVARQIQRLHVDIESDLQQIDRDISTSEGWAPAACRPRT